MLASVLGNAKAFEQYREILTEAGVKDPNEAALAFHVIRLAQGQTRPTDFLSTLAREFNLTPESAKMVVQQITGSVLSGISSDLPFPLEELRSGSIASASRGEDVMADEQQIEQELEELRQQKASILKDKSPLNIPQIVQNICDHPDFHFNDPLLRERCSKIIESRVRDVRTPEQTRAQLEKPIDTGGLGLEGRRLSDMLARLEDLVSVYQKNLLEEEQKKLAMMRAVSSDQKELAKKEERLMTKRYIDLTGKVPDAHVKPIAPDGARTSVAISSHHEQIAREGKIDATKVKAAIQAARQDVPVKHPQSVPTMQEVTFVKRLSGPIDELHTMTLKDFRRLSQDPSHCATKVRDKVDLLEEQGYDKKIDAIQAWRSSPLNQQYVEITRGAVLKGVPVLEFLRAKRATGEETLTDEELKVVMALNADLRF